MEASLKSIIPFLAILLTGLSAGLFYAWAVSVIPGTRKVIDPTYLETMQTINRAILNPGFYLIFMGSLLMLAISTFQHYPSGKAFWLFTAATICYLVGTFGITIFGNVPLNDTLDALSLQELTPELMATIRQDYEIPWNQFHMIRTASSVLSFLLALLASFSNPTG